jgi:hypothetical protein
MTGKRKRGIVTTVVIILVLLVVLQLQPLLFD